MSVNEWILKLEYRKEKPTEKKKKRIKQIDNPKKEIGKDDRK